MSLDAPALRYALLALGLLWVFAALRARAAVVMAVGLVFSSVASGFWVLGLAQPYGLFDDPPTTRRAAELAVAEAAPLAGSFLVGAERALPPVLTVLLGLGVSADSLIQLPSWLPVLTVPGVALAVGLLWARRDLALPGMCLWLAFHTGTLEALRSGGFLPSQWRQPEAALALPLVVALVLLASRLPLRRGVRVALGLLVLGFIAGIGLLAGPAGQAGLLDRIWLLTLDQGPWLWLALPALYRATDPSVLSLAAGGALLTLAPGASAWVAPWTAATLWRLGLLLGSAETLVALGRRIPEGVVGRLPRACRTTQPDRWVLAVALLLMLPGSFGSWWDPLRSDEAYGSSLQPVSPVYQAPMDWIRTQTTPDAVFLASEAYSPIVAVLGGRRVLRAPSLGVTADDDKRSRIEGLLLRGRPLPGWAAAYPVDFVFVGAGDFQERSLSGPEALEQRPGFRLRYADRNRYRVYELVRR